MAASNNQRRPVVAVDARPLAVIGNGVSRWLLELVRALHRRGDVELVLLSHVAPHPLHDLIGLRVHVDDAWSGRPGTLWLLLRMNIMARRLGADVVWATGHVVPPSVSGLRSVISVHDLVHRIMPGSMRFLHRLLSRILVDRSIRGASAVVALSRTTATDITRILGVEARRVTTILPGRTLLDETSPETMPDLPTRFLFALGSMEPRKNIDGLLAAFAHLARAQPNLSLVLTGLHRWNSDAIDAALRDPVLAGRVILTGYLNDAQITACMRASAAFVMASHYEGFGLPILEAAGKTTILLANTTIFVEVAGYLDRAKLIDFNDPEKAARSIAAALVGPREVSDVSPSAAAELTWEHAAERYAGLFLRLAHERPEL